MRKSLVDLSAAYDLTRISHPWLVTNCEWDNKLIRRAIVWLCQLTGKPILKLTNKDYSENGLGELLALYGSAYNVNSPGIQRYPAHDYRMAGRQAECRRFKPSRTCNSVSEESDYLQSASG